MPRFFFDVHEDGVVDKDHDGIELADCEEARRQAQALLPAIAYDKIPGDGDHKTYVVFVTDEDGKPIYSATLQFAGLWLFG